MSDHTALVARLRNAVERWYDGKTTALSNSVAADISDITDAIVSLMAERDKFYMDYRMKCDVETKALTAERDALRAEVETLKDQITHELIPDAANANLRAAEERERKLREALQEIAGDSASGGGVTWQALVARSALKDAP